MTRITDLAHVLVAAVLKPGDWAIDATVGNGHDTAFLAACVGPTGRVFGFDVQASAIAATTARVGTAASLFLAGHETMAAHLPRDSAGRIAAVMFNLGYLPGSDKSIITTATTTIPALAQALALLRPGGIVSIMLYRAHSGGAHEATAVLDWAATLDDSVIAIHHAAIGPPRRSLSPSLLTLHRRA